MMAEIQVWKIKNRLFEKPLVNLGIRAAVRE